MHCFTVQPQHCRNEACGKTLAKYYCDICACIASQLGFRSHIFGRSSVLWSFGNSLPGGGSRLITSRCLGGGGRTPPRAGHDAWGGGQTPPRAPTPQEPTCTWLLGHRA